MGEVGDYSNFAVGTFPNFFTQWCPRCATLEAEREDTRLLTLEVEALRLVVCAGRPWLAELVESGQANAIQADRALVLCRKSMGGVPPVPCSPRRWWTHAEPPAGFDPDFYQVARRVLAEIRDRGSATVGQGS